MYELGVFDHNFRILATCQYNLDDLALLELVDSLAATGIKLKIGEQEFLAVKGMVELIVGQIQRPQSVKLVHE